MSVSECRGVSTLGQVEDALRMIETLDVDLVAERVAVLVARAQRACCLRAAVVVAVEVDVAPQARGARPTSFAHVVVVIEHVFDGGRLAPP